MDIFKFIFTARPKQNSFLTMIGSIRVYLKNGSWEKARELAEAEFSDYSKHILTSWDFWMTEDSTQKDGTVVDFDVQYCFEEDHPNG